MQFLPTDSLTITTSLDAPTVKQRLTSLIEPPQTYLLGTRPPQQAPYSGNVVGSYLEFSRPVSALRNRYAPFVSGHIDTDKERTITTFEFHPNTLTQAGLLMLLIFTIGSTILMVASLFTGEALSGFMIMPYLGAGLFYAIHRSVYRAEVQRDKQLLSGVLLDMPEPERPHQKPSKPQEPHE